MSISISSLLSTQQYIHTSYSGSPTLVPTSMWTLQVPFLSATSAFQLRASASIVSDQALARRASPGLDLITALEQKWSTHVADLFAAHRPRSSTGQLHTGMVLKQQPIPRYLSFRLKDSLLSVSPSRVCLPPFWFSHHLSGLCLWQHSVHTNPSLPAPSCSPFCCRPASLGGSCQSGNTLISGF